MSVSMPRPVEMDLPFHQKFIRKRRSARLARYLSRLAGNSVSCRVNGFVMHLDIAEEIQFHMYLGLYEPAQTQWAREFLRPGNRMVDIGANFGYYTVLAESLVGSEGSIFAFEPSAVAAATIQDAVSSNRFRNVTIIRACVGSRAGVVDLVIPLNSSLHSPSVFGDAVDAERVSVPVLALDEYAPLRDGAEIDLVKIDAEGSEPDIIDGMAGLCEKGLVKNIFCELNSGWLKRNNSNPEKLRARILDLGFEVFRETAAVTGLETPKGPEFTVQDVWFRRAKPT